MAHHPAEVVGCHPARCFEDQTVELGRLEVEAHLEGVGFERAAGADPFFHLLKAGFETGDEGVGRAPAGVDPQHAQKASRGLGGQPLAGTQGR